ncbi:hypothetical protein [Nannocystis exedens]|uniref:hypothetical protein n=1 Tax=Nannocystis exedens TaxID=54 RepID=UPI000BBA0197|nr:hypothetical protein [Nannocystis exedens]
MASRRIDGLRDGKFTLAARSSRTFRVAAADMPIQSVGTLSSLYASAAVEGPDGTITSVSPPVYAEHEATYDVVKTYSPTAASARAAKIPADELMALRGRVFDGQALVDLQELPPQGGDGFRLGGGATILDPVDPARSLRAPDLPSETSPRSGPYSVKVCFTLNAIYQDAGFGEDVDALPPGPDDYPATQPVPASYLYATLKQDQTALWSGWLDASGCAPTKLLQSGTYSLVVQSRLSRDIGADAPAMHEVMLHSGEGDYLVGWARTFLVFGSGTLHLTPTTWDHAMNVAAVNARIFSQTEHLLDGVTNTIYVNKGCDSLAPTDSCAAPAAHEVYLGTYSDTQPSDAMSKFVVAQEHGHLLEWKGYSPLGDEYDGGDDPAEPLCRCDHVTTSNQTHCMQSRELYGAGYKEGFAHFFAARLYNERDGVGCTFVYYKQFATESLGVIQPPLALNCGFAYGYRDHQCTPPATGGDATAVELDFMRFLWNLHSSGQDRLSLTEMIDIFVYAKSAIGIPVFTWDSIVNSATMKLGAGAKLTNLITLGSLHGVDDDYGL